MKYLIDKKKFLRNHHVLRKYRIFISKEKIICEPIHTKTHTHKQNWTQTVNFIVLQNNYWNIFNDK